MADPSSNVADRMLPHLHLISTFRYPEKIHLNIRDPAATNWLVNALIAAPGVARDNAPFFWTYLDTPRDGQIMLTWQPLARLQTHFASDGYIWPGPDEFHRVDLKNGLVLEAFSQRIGYRPGEEVAAHARTRFRLAPATNQPVPGMPQVDAALWIVHYGPAQQIMPIQMLPIPAQMHATMNQRSTLQRAGQIPRKEFMLADRSSWPTIHPPPMARGHPMMVQPGNTRNVPQAFAYPTPSKRSKTAAHAQQHMVPASATFMTYEDEEDTSAGDVFDHMTPRELSVTRYTRNHEWMEEVIHSVYRVGQIVPTDLGLGLQGELSTVTQGIFEPSGVDAHLKPPTKPVVGHLDTEQAALFRQRVADKILADQTEMAKMKIQHEKRLSKLRGASNISRAEQDLRVAVDETGPEFWRLEGKEEDDEEGDHPPTTTSRRKVDDIVADIESALGRHIQVVSDVKRIQDGGYQEPAPEPKTLPVPPPAPVSDPNETAIGEGDVDMGGTSTGPTNSTDQTRQPAPPSNPAASASASEDVTMQNSDQNSNTVPDQGTGSGDWVVVHKGGVSPTGASAAPVGAGPSEPAQIPGGDFGDLNTAGEALNSYGHDLGDGMDLGGVEDSAFGDAVFGVEESRGSAANTPAEGL